MAQNDRCQVLCSQTSCLGSEECLSQKSDLILKESHVHQQKKIKKDQVSKTEYVWLKCCALEVAEAPEQRSEKLLLQASLVV